MVCPAVIHFSALPAAPDISRPDDDGDFNTRFGAFFDDFRDFGNEIKVEDPAIFRCECLSGEFEEYAMIFRLTHG